MDKETLFRGKRVDNGEWVYGDLIHEPHGMVIQYYKNKKRIKATVYPKTVCQYIGTQDKNGRKIFKGDLVRREIFGDFIVGQVVWFDIGFCGFCLKYKNCYYHIGKDENTGMCCEDEIIGNIFEVNKVRQLEKNERCHSV